MEASSSHAPRCAVAATMGRSQAASFRKSSGSAMRRRGESMPKRSVSRISANERALWRKLARARARASFSGRFRCRMMLSVASLRRAGSACHIRRPKPLPSRESPPKPRRENREAQPESSASWMRWRRFTEAPCRRRRERARVPPVPVQYGPGRRQAYRRSARPLRFSRVVRS